MKNGLYFWGLCLCSVVFGYWSATGNLPTYEPYADSFGLGLWSFVVWYIGSKFQYT